MSRLLTVVAVSAAAVSARESALAQGRALLPPGVSVSNPSAPVSTTFPMPMTRQIMTIYTGGGAYRSFQIQVQSFSRFYFSTFITVSCVGGGFFQAPSGSSGMDQGLRVYTIANECADDKADSLQFEVGPLVPGGQGGSITVTAFP